MVFHLPLEFRAASVEGGISRWRTKTVAGLKMNDGIRQNQKPHHILHDIYAPRKPFVL
jgi:hypothetical protein